MAILNLVTMAWLLTVALAVQTAGESYAAGVKLFSEGKLEAALAQLERAVELRPNHAASWNAIGVVHAARGNYALAETPFRKACELAPRLPGPCFDYGRVLYLLDRFEAALQALKEEKRTGQVYRLMALSLEGLRRTSEAEVAFKEAIRLDGPAPPNEDPRIDYGVFLFRQGRTAESLAPLQTAVKLRPNSSRAHVELGRALLTLEHLEPALSHLQKAVSLDSRSARAHLLLGKLYLRMGKPEAAEDHLRQGSRTVK